MRSLTTWWIAAAGLATLTCVGPAAAQNYNSPYSRMQPNSFARPALSPYLNLIRGGDPAANYFLGTLPEFDRRANAVRFGSAIQDLEERVGGDLALGGEAPLALTTATGHPVAFGNTGSYFGGGPAARPGVGTAGTAGGGLPGARRGR
jgi:hypothetical protein